ncbi:hypothetical protein CMUS01_10488 [Colletotrichum musicola]|uniref:Chitin-binding type-1 domain-containing protein n=1 Tax=Colletotrichum musicola TaxID=2175873 RepID=A0A8H6K2M2_9PEZI|nr:hypothetical protein CMUS01_10488 [Colletotrichum musicola]
MKPSFLIALAALRAGQSVPGVGDVVCRYKAKTPSAVNYYTCSQMVSKYVTTVEKFFELNPGVAPDRSNINPSSEYCVKGCTCWEGACKGFPSKYSMDGRCGASADGLLCGGKWGNCCSKYGYCGNGTNFCSLENCYSGDCEIPVRQNNGLPWLTGTTRNGSCGGAEGYTCDMAFGNCCSKDGVCGALVEHCGAGCSAGYCGAGWQSAFGDCSAAATTTKTTSSATPSPTNLSLMDLAEGPTSTVAPGRVSETAAAPTVSVVRPSSTALRDVKVVLEHVVEMKEQFIIIPRNKRILWPQYG